MDAQGFLAEFGHIVNAPGGMARLRDLILELAIRGELLSSSTGTSDARMLLSEIVAFRAELVRTGKLRRPTPQPDIQDSELAFNLPANWAFERLGNVCEIVRGVTFPSSQKQTTRSTDSIACLRTSNVQAEIDWDDLIFIEPKLVGREDQWVEKGDTMISMANSYELVGKVALVREVKERATFGGFIAAVRPHVLEPDYLYLVLRSPYMQAKMRVTASQTTNIANISLGGMRPIPTPIPPKEEQTRIVAKVDELMALCGKLEAQQQARRKLQNNLRQSTLQAVASATSPHELQTTWTRLADNFGRLFHAPGDVAELRSLVLDLAMRGLLVTQEASDEPATILCKKIDAEKRKLSKHKKLKLQRSLPELGDDETPYDVPTGWKWIRLGLIAELINGDRGKNYPNKDEYVSVGVPWINTGHIEPDGTLTQHHMNFISQEKFESLNSGKIEKGDLVYCLRGATYGKTAFVTPYEEGAIASSLMIIRAILPPLSRYLYYYLISPLGRSQIFRFDNGTAQPNLSANSVGLFTYPLPPLAEQHRIADKIEQLMKFCDSLESQLLHSLKLAGQFAITAVAGITGIATEQEEDKPVKVPQSELIAPLRLGQAPDIKSQAPLATILARHNGEISAKDLWQRFGGEIDAFYAQLKTEVTHGWIQEPTVAEMREKFTDTASA